MAGHKVITAGTAMLAAGATLSSGTVNVLIVLHPVTR